MTADEAIKVNSVLMRAPVLKDDPKVVEALKLSNEALKRHKEMSALVPSMPYPLLPGETKD